jgi:DNA invertase Pin-like site-specific DNA recombinase
MKRPEPISAIAHLYAALAEKERALISRRTKEALAAAKARGVRLGGLNAKGIENQRVAAEHAEALRQVFGELAGFSARKAAEELNRRGIQTFAGGRWYATQVVRVRARRLMPRDGPSIAAIAILHRRTCAA